VWRDDECGFLYNSPKPGGSEYNRGYTEDNGETTPVMAASSSGLAEYRSDMVPTSLLVAHWGRLGAGPRITARMTEALAAVQGVEVIASVDVNADSIPALPADDIRLENTYTRRWEILFRLPRLIALSLRTRRWMNQRGIQVYFSPMMSIWGALAIWLMVPRSVQAVVVVHDAQQHPGDRHPLLEVCRRVEIARADVLVAFSKHSADELRKHVSRKKRIIWVPHGTDVDTTLAPRLAPRDQPIVGFFGRISEYKGIDLFVDSIRSLRDQVPSARGRVVGDGDVPDGLMDESERDIEWRVGWVDEHEVETVVDDFDVILLPYREASQSGVLPLAASRGVPAVVTPVGGLAEQAAALGNAVIAGAMETTAVVDATALLLTDPARYSELSRTGIARSAGDTSWDSVARRLLEQLAMVRA
jgi:glycosyltransferase involved in cell wall biosynthesis